MWGLAASMGVTTSYALKWTVQHFRVRGSLMIPFVVFLLVMMLSMVVSAVVYLYSPSINMLIGLVVANMLVMGAGALPFVFVMFRALLADHEPGQGGDGDPSAPPPAGAGFPHRDALVEGTVIGLAAGEARPPRQPPVGGPAIQQGPWHLRFSKGREVQTAAADAHLHDVLRHERGSGNGVIVELEPGDRLVREAQG